MDIGFPGNAEPRLGWTGNKNPGAGGLPDPGYIGPERQLPASGSTTRTLQQVQRMRGHGRIRGEAFNEYLAESTGGTREIYTPTQLGPRFHDIEVPQRTQTLLRIEGKNYLTYRTINHRSVAQEVRLTKELHRQIYKDVLWIREGRKQGINRVVQWEFAGAPPSRELAETLEFWGLPYAHK